MKQMKRWQEPIYAIGGFGPGFLYQFSLVYLLLYYMPALKLIEKGALVFAPAVGFAAATLIARVLDGVVDIPIATWTDNMKSRWGRRRPLMVLGYIPMVICFVLLWYPPVTGSFLGADGHWGNAIYVALMSSAFFFSYTLITVPYLAALSEIVPDEKSRVRVASWQTAFNTAGFALVFVGAPILFENFGIRGTVWLLLPIAISFIGPILVIKEESTQTDQTASQPNPGQQDVPLWQSLKLSLNNRTFRVYLVSFAIFFFGLQFFLGGIAFMALDMMDLSESQLGLMNAAVFAPVPIMLLLFNFVARKKGAKWGFQVALLIFAVAMLLYPLAWTRFDLPLPPMAIGIILGVICSFSVGVFFTIPYAFPAHIAAVEAEETGKNRAGMYFAVQGLINQGMGSLAAAMLAFLLTWEYGYVAIGPITGVLCIIACFLFAPYPLGQPSQR
ncbi:MAG: MFS transporter [Pseudomonadales bacterium]|jgi:GPH family glycoside/pentoside/hexuronide:cation symporter|nr:MFS transporter [Pseudomonadales bacterium]